MRVHIECFLMIAVDNASDSVFCISTTIRLEGSLIEVILIFCIGERSGIRLKVFNVLLHLFEPLLLFYSLFLLLPLPNSFSYLDILTVFFPSFYLWFSRPRPILRIEGSILRNIGLFVGNARVIDNRLVGVTLNVRLANEGNALFLLT